MTREKRVWANSIFLVLTIVLNVLGAIGLINGMSQEEVSNKYDTFITPSPMTFSIWAVLYTALIISVIVLFVQKDKSYYGRALDKISIPFWISCFFNIAWIISFSFEAIGISSIFIFLLLISLCLLCTGLLRVQEGKRWLLPISFGLYTGWIAIASVVNIAALLVQIQWDRFGLAESTWAVLILIVSAGILFLINLALKNAAFPLPAAWAYLGIFLKIQENSQTPFFLLKAVSLIGVVFLIAIAGIQFYRNGFSVLPANEDRIIRDRDRSTDEKKENSQASGSSTASDAKTNESTQNKKPSVKELNERYLAGERVSEDGEGKKENFQSFLDRTVKDEQEDTPSEK